MSAGEFKPVIPTPRCHHLWIQDKPMDEAEDSSGLFVHRRYYHKCPKCGKTKTTNRRILK